MIGTSSGHAILPPTISCEPGLALPPSVTYIERSEIPEEAYVRSSNGDAAGCCCSGCCTSATCPCCRRNALREMYDVKGCLLPLLHGLELDHAVAECGPGCACGWACPTAITARGLCHRVRLQRHPGKGVGAAAGQRIPRGAFVCEYAGEYISREEALRRLRLYDGEGGGTGGLPGHALLVVRELLPSGAASLRVNIDATRRRNVAGFFNHSCDGGNLEPVLVHSSGLLVPRVALFARRDILPGDELTFAYGPPNATPSGRRCACGTAACLGYLPNSSV